MAMGRITYLLRRCLSNNKHSESQLRALRSNPQFLHHITGVNRNSHCSVGERRFSTRTSNSGAHFYLRTTSFDFVHQKPFSTDAPSDVVADADESVAVVGGDQLSLQEKELVASRDPVEIDRQLRDAEKADKQTRADWGVLTLVFQSFAKSGWASNQALAIYIGASFFPTAAHRF